jgi:uncharacterized membrane protein
MSGKSKWLAIGLLLSVAVNIFIIGVMIGKNTDGMRQRGSFNGGDRYNIRSLSKYLTEEERSDVRVMLKRYRPVITENMKALRQNERAIRALIEADTVDMAQMNSLLADNERYSAASRWPVRRLLLEYVAGLDHKTRLAVAKDLFRGRARGDHKRLRSEPRPETPQGSSLEQD